MEPFGEATFQFFASRIFRTEMNICWGKSQKNLGLLIMLNPVSASLLDKHLLLNYAKSKLKKMKFYIYPLTR